MLHCDWVLCLSSVSVSAYLLLLLLGNYWGFSAAIICVFPQIELIMRRFGVSELELLFQGDYGACVYLFVVCLLCMGMSYEDAWTRIYRFIFRKQLYYSLSIKRILNTVQQPVPFHLMISIEPLIRQAKSTTTSNSSQELQPGASFWRSQRVPCFRYCDQLGAI